MCEFCVQHGEGRRWYEVAALYSEDLFLRDDREVFLREFMTSLAERYERGTRLLRRFRRVPGLGSAVRREAERRQKRAHWGQVVSLDDALRVLELQDHIVRLPCVCRRVSLGREVRYCLGFGRAPAAALADLPEFAGDLEPLSLPEARRFLQSLDDEALVHSVWTFKTPFIGGMCNCDGDCLAYRMQVRDGLMDVMFPGETSAYVDPAACTGCRACLSLCRFDALAFDPGDRKMRVRKDSCFGCGLCRRACGAEAITLVPAA